MAVVEDTMQPSYLHTHTFTATQRMDLLYFVKKLGEYDDGIRMEIELNLFLAKYFNCEMAFIMYKDNTTSAQFYMRTAGKRKLTRATFQSQTLENSIQLSDGALCKDDFDQDDMQVLRCLLRCRVQNVTSSYDEEQRVLTVLVNSFIVLENTQLSPDLEIQNGTNLTEYCDFTPRAVELFKEVLRVLYPVIYNYVEDETVSKSVSFFAKIAEKVILCMYSNRNWTQGIVNMSRDFFNADSAGIYLPRADRATMLGTVSLAVEGKTYERQASYDISTSDGALRMAIKGEEGIVKNSKSRAYIRDNSIIANFVGVPLKLGQHLFGAFQIVSFGGITDISILNDVRAIANLCSCGLFSTPF